MKQAQHYHIFWKYVIVLVILILVHIFGYLPEAKKHYNETETKSLFLKVIKYYATALQRFEKYNGFKILLIINGVIQTLLLTLSPDPFARETYNQSYMIPTKKYNETPTFIDIYDVSEYFTLAIIPIIIYLTLKFYVIKKQ